MNKKVNVEKLIETFSDMAKRKTLLTGENVTQEDLLMQIIGTIVKCSLEKDEKEEKEKKENTKDNLNLFPTLKLGHLNLNEIVKYYDGLSLNVDGEEILCGGIGELKNKEEFKALLDYYVIGSRGYYEIFVLELKPPKRNIYKK